MVKLSEIIRKAGEEKPKEKKLLVAEVVKAKKELQTLPEIKKVYENAILGVKQIMNDIRKGKTIEGKKVTDVAEKIIDTLKINKNIMLSLINDFALYEKEEDYLYQHSVNASILAASLGLAFGYGESELVDLCASTLLHDIGILRVPREIIVKPSKLTKEEDAQIKKHPGYGLELLEKVIVPPKSAAEVIHQHHERIDGSGYPEGKKGKEISKYAKIVAIVEVYEALTHPRPYHRNIPYEGARMIVREADASFEPELVKLFLNHITPYPPGSYVLLNNNEIGRVASINEGLPLRPVVEIVLNAEGNPPEKSKTVDLSKSTVLNIKRALEDSNI